MDIRKSCNEADIDFSGFPLETVLDLLVKAEFMNKDGGSFTVRVRHTIEKMMIESSEFSIFVLVRFIIKNKNHCPFVSRRAWSVVEFPFVAREFWVSRVALFTIIC